MYLRKEYPHKLLWSFDIEQLKINGDDIPIIKRESININVIKDGIETTVFGIKVKRFKNKNTPEIFDANDNVSGKNLFSCFDESNNLTKNELFRDFNKEIHKSIDYCKKDNNASILSILLGMDKKINNLHSMFTNLNEYNITPDIAREEGDFLPYAEMQPNGKGLSNVIYALEKKNYGNIQSYRRQQNEWFYNRRRYFGRSILHPRIYSYSFTRNHFMNALNNINSEIAKAVYPINNVSVSINKTNGKKLLNFETVQKDKFYPDEVSDGTIKWLAILVSLYIPFSDIYLLEEPENFLHPWMQQQLIEIMRKEAEKSETIFILTTHSPVILNKANTDEVIIVKRDCNNSTVINNISNDNEIQEFLCNSEFGLGDLWISGAIGAVPGD